MEPTAILRFALRSTLFLAIATILGAMTTIAIAWYGAATVRAKAVEFWKFASGPDGLFLGWESSGQITELVWIRVHSTTRSMGESTIQSELPTELHWSMLSDPRATQQLEAATSRQGSTPKIFEIASGWPKVALVSRFTGDKVGPSHPFQSTCLSGIALSDWPLDNPPGQPVENLLPQPRALPLAPYWPGFLTNTAIFAAPWLLLFLSIASAKHLRRTLRARRGNCVACGYSRAGLTPLAPCPECAAVPALPK